MTTVLLTGATGFLGSKVTEFLLKDNFRVLILLRKESNLDRIKDVLDDKNLVKIYLDEKNFESTISQFTIDIVIHTATCYGRNDEYFSKIYEANLILPLRLLSISEQMKVKLFINADTFFNEKIVFSNNESFYVKTKKIFLDIAKDVLSKTNIRFVNLKIEQMYGPRDNHKKFFPTVISKLLAGHDIALTPGEQRRDFVFVDDVATAFVNTVKNYHNLDIYNEFGIGMGKSISIKEAVECLKNITKSTSNLEFGKLPYRENEIMDSFADISNNVRISWTASTHWQEGFLKTVEYYRKIS